jgi:hypothetical protein
MKTVGLDQTEGIPIGAEVEPDVPVIWCITENSSYADRIPFGEKVFVNTAEFY